MSLTLHEQLTKHIEDQVGYSNVFPHKNWTLDQYQEMFKYIDEGWLMQTPDHYCGFIVNPDWEGEPMWEPEEEEEIECVDCDYSIKRDAFDAGKGRLMFNDTEHSTEPVKLVRCGVCDDRCSDPQGIFPNDEEEEEEEDSSFGTTYHDGSGFDDCDPNNTGWRKCREEGVIMSNACSECIYLTNSEVEKKE